VAERFLEGKVALVTGGSRGIGRAISSALAAAGAAVAVHYNSRESHAAETVGEIRGAGGRAESFPAELSAPGPAAALVRAVEAALGPVAVLVNNAGEMSDHRVESMPDEAWERSLSVNLSAAFRLCRACIPAMRAARWGRIISISSQAAFTGSARHAHYAAAKAGLLGLTYSLAKELALDGITVNVVAPGRIETEMITTRMEGRREEWLGQVPMRRFGTPGEVSGAVRYLASPDAGYVTGAVLQVNGGMLMG
jgi:3-oxoacyl-[acyl-carrier protein] reductase